MKAFIFIAALFFSSLLHAQRITLTEARRYADQLAQKEILSIRGSDALRESFITDSSTSLYKDYILRFCSSVFAFERDNRLMSKNPVEYRINREDSLAIEGFTFYPPLSALGNHYENYLSDKRSTIGFTRTRTLEDFKSIGLISDKVYADCKKGLLDKSIKDEVSLLKQMVKLSDFPRD